MHIPPEFGHETARFFSLDSKYVNLNNGSYGALPLCVKHAVSELESEIELAPDRFIRLRYPGLLKKARERIAGMIGAETDECVFIPSATTAIATVLRNFEWDQDDIIVNFSTTNLGVARNIHYLSDISPRNNAPRVHTIPLTFPTTHQQILQTFQSELHALVHSQQSMSAKGAKWKIVAVIDSIVSMPAALLPWREMVTMCHMLRKDGREVWSIIDAAHSLGQEQNINLSETKPDFWISNAYKWLYAKRGCTVLYVPHRNQHLIKSALPTAWNYVPGLASPTSDVPMPEDYFVSQFDGNNFMPAAFLSVLAALDFRTFLRGEKAIYDYCHNLAVQGGRRLAKTLKTEVMPSNGDEIVCCMINVRLPLPSSLSLTPAQTAAAHEKLLDKWDCFAHFFKHGDGWWVRCCAQVWNELSDFDYLGRALLDVFEDYIESE